MSTEIFFSFKPVQLDRFAKDMLMRRVKEFIASSERLSRIVNRVAVRAGRIYLYHLVEPFLLEGEEVQDLVDGKYNEFPFARLTLSDRWGNACTVDWQRPNGQWVSLYKGSLTECLQFIQDDEAWFYHPPGSGMKSL